MKLEEARAIGVVMADDDEVMKALRRYRFEVVESTLEGA